MADDELHDELEGEQAMSARETSGAPHNDRLAPRFLGAAPGGPFSTTPSTTHSSPVEARRYTLRWLIAVLKAGKG